MKKTLGFFLTTLLIISLSGCSQTKKKVQKAEKIESAINQFLDQWHLDVASFDYDAYFQKMAETSIFVVTDASEVWTKQEFQEFSKPYFDKRETWNFKAFDRNVYLDENTRTAWFDELLDTWMGTCRGSGVVVFEEEDWRIQHYVLSVAIPNESIKEVIEVKKEKDSLFIHSLED